MGARSFTPIKLRDLDKAEDTSDVVDLFQDLLAEINDRFSTLYDGASGRGPTTSNQALQRVGTLASTVPLGSGVQFNFSATGTLTIPGFTGGYGGRIVVIKNTSIYTYTVAHESTTALDRDRVSVRTGTGVAIAAGAALVMIYDDVLSRWIPLCTQV